MDEDARLYFGTCAWTFDDWREVFYPAHLPATERLAFYARWFSAVEVDSTFYHPPAPHVAAHWAEVTPAHFRFSCKLPREITHERKLRDFREPLAEFLQGVEPLGEKLGCILVQLPPWFEPRHDELALREFILHLPRAFRWAVEFREHHWRFPRIGHLLEEHGVSWVWNDISILEEANAAAFDFHPRTAEFAVVRLLGDATGMYHPDGSAVHQYRALKWDRSVALENWAAKVKLERPHLKELFVFAGNQYEGFAPLTLRRFAGELGIDLPLPDPKELRDPPSATQEELWG